MEQARARSASELSLRPQFQKPCYRRRQAALGSGTTDNQGPLVSSMENKGTRMFTNHIHNGPSQKPSQQHSECMNCGARPRWMLESWDEERAPGVQRGLRPLTGAEGHPRVHCRIQCMQVEPSQNAPPLRSGGQHLWGGVPEGPASAPGASQSGYIGEQSKVTCTLL